MKPSSICIRGWIITALFTIFAPCVAKGDGGIVRLHQAQGPFSVTVFVSSGAVRGGLADVSVLVQARENGEAVLDADVILTLNPPVGLWLNQSEPLCGLPSPSGSTDSTEHQLNVRATREQASNKLLYAAPLQFHADGDWRLHVLVLRGPDSASFDCLLPVAMASTKLTGLWPYLALPPVAVVAFAMNQNLRRRSLEKGPRGPPKNL